MSDETTARSDISRRYRQASVEQPPEHLDRAILAAASAARHPVRQPILRPLALAASAILCVAIVLLLLPAAPDGGTSSPATAAAPVDPPRACDEQASAETTSWYACIVALRESGHTEAAERELELLRSSYPEFAAH